MNIAIIGIYLVSFVLAIVEQKNQGNETWRAYRGSKSALIGGLVLGLIMAVWTAMSPSNENAIYFVNGIEVGRGGTAWLDIGVAFLGTVMVVGGSLLFVSWLTAGILAKDKSPERMPNLLASFALIGSIAFVIIAIIFIGDETLSIFEIVTLVIWSGCDMALSINTARVARRNKTKISMFMVFGMIFPIVFPLVIFISFIVIL